VSITDDVRGGSRPVSSPPDVPAPRDGQFERTPPQDIAAEQCVLGGMLLSKDAIADVVEILRSSDFYRPVHATIFEAILDLYGRGEPADPITVAAALADSGDLARVGGAPYLHTLIASVPTAANTSYYARIVAERAVLRRLVEAGTRIVQLGYGAAGGGRDVDDVVDLAQQAIYDVTERRVSEDFAVLADILQPTLDEIEAVGSQSGVMTGVPTGFTDLDRLLNGLHPGQLIVVAGRPGLGKALALDTPLPTPDGWTTMGEVRVGDRLLGADGRPTTVTAAFEVRYGRPCYEVEFSDGSVIVADAEHLWKTTTRAGRLRRPEEVRHDRPDGALPVAPRRGVTLAAVAAPPAEAATVTEDDVVTTEQIRATLWDADGAPAHAVRTCAPLDLPERELPVPPYVLGVRLGSGTGGGGTRGTGGGGARIPAAYLRASAAQRRALLAGLMDAGGTVEPTGDLRFTTTSRAVALDVRELVVSLGHCCTLTTERVPGRPASDPVYALRFRTSDVVFRLARKRAAHRAHRRAGEASGAEVRYVVAVRPVPSVPVRCVTVDNPDHLYLAGRSMIPTHNSTVSMDFARNAAIRYNCASAIFSLEMSKIEIVMRLLSAEARVPLHVLRSGQLSDDDWTKLARRMGEISEAPLFVDDTPNMNLMEIRAKARRLKQRHDLKMIVVDYLQLMTSSRRVESRQQEVAELSRGLKLLAKEIECPVVAVSQLNRGPEQRTDKRPQLSDLRESGCLTADTRVLRADTGAETTMGELFATGARDVPVWALDERLRYVRRHLTHVFPTGERPVFRLRLESGREIRATANHPFLTYQGWTPLADLAVGDRIAVPRHVCAPERTTVWDDRQVILLAHLLGDGATPLRQPIRYASADVANIEAVRDAATYFGVTAVRDDPARAGRVTLRLPAPDRLTRDDAHPVAAWLESLGLWGRPDHERFVPADVFALPKGQIALFLRHLWATDGAVSLDAEGAGGAVGRVSYTSGSRRLVEDVARLLWRFGIQSRVTTTGGAGHRDGHRLDVHGAEDQEAFCRVVGVHGRLGDTARRLQEQIRNRRAAANLDTVPREVWERAATILADRDVPHRQLALVGAGARSHGGTPPTPGPYADHGPSHERIARVAALLDDNHLEMLATNDVTWDCVTAVEPAGVEPVYDATVLGAHNFVANGIAVHNSIEQDADVVILLHRDDYYDKESPRAGEADFIVAKHRNGPTDTITVAAQLHLARFVDMAVV
jgi:replicative DNA helicase